MSSILGNFFGNAALRDYFTNRATWLALHEHDPTATGDLSTEVNGGGYARERIHWTDASAKTIASTDTQIFNDLPDCTIRYLAVWDDDGAGHVMVRIALDDSIEVDSGGQFTAFAGDVAFSL